MRRLWCLLRGCIRYWKLDPPKLGQVTIWARPHCIRCGREGQTRPIA